MYFLYTFAEKKPRAVLHHSGSTTIIPWTDNVKSYPYFMAATATLPIISTYTIIHLFTSTRGVRQNCSIFAVGNFFYTSLLLRLYIFQKVLNTK